MDKEYQGIIYKNIDYLHSKNKLTYKDIAIKLDIPFNTIKSWKKRNTYIDLKYSKKISRKLKFNREYLFNHLLEETEGDMHIYTNFDNYVDIQKKFYFRLISRDDAFDYLCRIMRNSVIKTYIDSSGMLRVKDDDKRNDRSYTSWIIRIDNSVSSKDPEAVLKAQEFAYEEEKELIKYMVNRINRRFPLMKHMLQYKRIFIDNVIYEMDYFTIRRHYDYDKDYHSFLRDKEKSMKFGYDSFTLFDEKRLKRIFDLLRVTDIRTGKEVTDLNTKIKLCWLYWEEKNEKKK